MRGRGSLHTRGLRGAARRAGAILQRYGATPRRMLRNLEDFTHTCQAYGVRPTFPIVASCAITPQKALAKLQEAGAIFACHGYRHIDYTSLSEEEQAAEIRTSVEVLERSGIEFSGFRAPYLRTNGTLRKVIANQGFAFDSSEGVLWPIVDGSGEHPLAEAVIGFYEACPVSEEIPLPTDGAVVQLPVSLPDDEMCVERLRMAPEVIAEQWRQNLQQAFALRAMYVLQLHPERFGILRSAAEHVLDAARALSPRLWLTTPGEVAEWWLRRKRTEIHLSRSEGAWIATTRGASEAALEVVEASSTHCRQPEGQGAGAQVVRIEGDGCPAIGLSHRTPGEIERRLREAGFHCQRSNRPALWNCYLDLTDEQAVATRPKLMGAVGHNASGPLVRLADWPGGYCAAFCVTGDIDALCLFDFLKRI